MTKKISIYNAFKDFLDSKLSNSRENAYLKIDEKTDLYIQKLQISYEVEENQGISEIKYLYIEGYILTK